MATRPLYRVRWNICLLLVALLLLSWGYFAFIFTRDHRALEEQCASNLKSLTMDLEVHVRQAIDVVDLLLVDIARHFSNYPAAELQMMFSDWFRHSPELVALFVADTGSAEILFSLNAQALSEHISIPSFSAPLGNEFSLQIADRLYSASDGKKMMAVFRQFRQGERLILVVSFLRAEYLLGMHREVYLGPNGYLSIFHDTGILLARKPEGDGLVGGSFAGGPLFSKLLPDSLEGLSRTAATTDGVSQIIAHRKLANLPLVVTVGTSADWIFAEWQKRLFNFLLIQFAVSITILFSLVMLFRTLTRVEKVEIGLEEREEHFRSVANSSVDAVISVDAEEKVRFWSVGAEQIFSCRATESMGMPIACFLQFSKEDKPLTLKQLAETNQPGSQQRILDVEGQRKNGELFPSELSISSGTASGQQLYTLIVRDVTERKLMEDRIRRMASHDNLTGLPNRGLLMDRLQVAMAQTRRKSGQFALLFIDLDQFKPVNDNYGHDTGDQLLQQVAKRLLAAVRASDTVARVGGDEFAILLTNVEDEDSVRRACEHILASTRRNFIVAGNRLVIGCSIGVALFEGQDDLTAIELIGRADIAMYTAKRAGKNCYAFADGEAPCCDAGTAGERKST